MGAVYKAWDHTRGAFVALKLMRDVSMRDRFEREARVLSGLRHRSIVQYVGYGVTEQGEPWLAMEWLEGEDLEARLLRGALGVQDTLSLARSVADGLACAHNRGLVHRDVKPSNLLLPGGDIEAIKILDFGLARAVGPGQEITKTGMLMGTLEYMPPEQVQDAKRADARADVYSFGAVLFHCLAGRPPFEGPMAVQMMSILNIEAPSVLAFRPDTPGELAWLIARMLQKDPLLRPANGAAVAAALACIDEREALESLTAVRAPIPGEPAEAPVPSRSALPPRSSPPSGPRWHDGSRTVVMPSSPGPLSAGASNPTSSRPPVARSGPAFFAWGLRLLVLALGLMTGLGTAVSLCRGGVRSPSTAEPFVRGALPRTQPSF